MTTGHSGHDHDQLRELLEICEDFFLHASPVTRHELEATLRARGITGGPGWLIDMLGFARLRLQHEHEHDATAN
jgi:hypothetical protein